jgi:hypothetical protein
VNTFRSYLTELFDRPFPVREYKRLGYGPTTMEVTYHAQDEGGRDLMIDITGVGKQWEINFTLDGSHDLTHYGKPFRVLATVVKAAELFLKWYMEEFGKYPEELHMISKRSESKRDTVYSALMRRFGKKYGYTITDRFITGTPKSRNTVTTAKLTVLPWEKVEAAAKAPKGMKWKDPLNPLRGMVPEARDYAAEYAKMYGGDNPTPKQRKAMKKKTARKRVLRRMGREGRSTDGKEIDHKNGNALDSRPSNLRLVSRHTNRSKDNNKWRK